MYGCVLLEDTMPGYYAAAFMLLVTIPGLLHFSCSALCNDSVLSYQPSSSVYNRIGESTELALRVFVEKVRRAASGLMRLVLSWKPMEPNMALLRGSPVWG